MSVIVKHIPYSVHLDKPVKKTFIDTMLATEDNLAHCFDIILLRDEEVVMLPSNAAVTAYFIRYSDNATISLPGTASGNVISVTLNKSCYNKAGQYAIIIKVTDGDVIHTVFYGEGTILTSITDTILDPENVVPSISDLLAQIAVMEKGTAAAEKATTDANAAAVRANNAAADIEGMTVSAASGTSAAASISKKNGVKHISFTLPKGEKGDKGDPGTIENVSITSINGLPEALSGKLGTNETASDSNKLGGVAASEYARKTDVLLSVYPVGSIYMSVNSTNPATIFGGTWEQLKDRFLLGAGDSYTAGSTGGEAEHTLTIEEMPSHYHWMPFYTKTAASDTGLKGGYSEYNNLDPSGGHYNTDTNGGGLAHNNMPPYLTIYMWKRVS